jgi:dihydropteroate synthase
MGILNVTPDSFFDKGAYFSLDLAIQQGLRLFQDGADILDVGGESTRPGAPIVSEEEELRRVIPVISALKPIVPIPISIDTVKPAVALAAVGAGATLINDVSGFRNPAMREIAATTGVDVCVMHMQGTPETMQRNPHYESGVVSHILQWFEQQIEMLIEAGVKEKNIILDPGIGFGKTVAHNLDIIQNLSRFKEMGFPLLLGVSRKSLVAKRMNKSKSENPGGIAQVVFGKNFE